jgi:hypothetical protein
LHRRLAAEIERNHLGTSVATQIQSGEEERQFNPIRGISIAAKAAVAKMASTTALAMGLNHLKAILNLGIIGFISISGFFFIRWACHFFPFGSIP